MPPQSRQTDRSEAILDAAVVFGAKRYIEDAYDDSANSFYGTYVKANDQILFLEFTHNLVLYKDLIIDNSSLAERHGQELLAFIDTINYTAGDKIINVAPIGNRASGIRASQATVGVRYGFCEYLSELLHNSSGIITRLSAVAVPWAYKTKNHYDYYDFDKLFTICNIDKQWMPFALFTWRAIVYSAFALNERKRDSRPVTYVASPGRLKALKAVLNASDIAGYEWPRDGWRKVVSELPALPMGGYDFSFLSSLPAFETSVLNANLRDMQALDALRYVMNVRKSSEGRAIMEDWADIVFDGPTCAIGSGSIQIMKNVNVTGNLNQTQWICATPNTGRIEKSIWIGGG